MENTTGVALYPFDPMYDENGEMRMVPGWKKVERYNEIIGRDMPYAVKVWTIAHDNEGVLWTARSENDKQILFFIGQLQAPYAVDRFRFEAKDDVVEERTKPNGKPFARRFKPCAIYKVQKNNNIRKGRKPRRKSTDNPDIVGLPIGIFYPLFRVYEVEETTRIKRNNGTVTRKRKADPWSPGPWTLNDNGAELWHAAHPNDKLVRASDGRWHHTDFYELEHKTTVDTRYTDSTINEREDLGLFLRDGKQYVFKLSKSCRDVELYEAHMAKMIRRQNSASDQLLAE